MSSGKFLGSVVRKSEHHHDSIKEDEEEDDDVFYQREEDKKNTPVVMEKTRFGSLALKVMTQIAKDKRHGLIPATEENGRGRKVSTGSESPVVTPKSLDRNFNQFQFRERRASDKRNFRRSSGAPMLASIARLMKFRRMSGQAKGTSKRRSSSVSTSNMSVLPEDELTDLPINPRFCATLSPEAQYAMLRGYEDVIIESLIQEHPEYHSVLQRSSNPDEGVIVSPRAENSSRSSVEKVNLTYKEQSNIKLHTDSQTEQIPCLSSRTWNRTKDQKKKENVLPEIPKDKQLLLSSRFQRAMDILDSVKQSRGMLVTSARPGIKRINPLHHYSSWSQSWEKEFQFKAPDT